MVDGDYGLGHHVQQWAGGECVVAPDHAAGECVLDRQKAELRLTTIHRLRHIEELAAGNRLGALPPQPDDPILAVRAELSLKGDASHTRAPSRAAERALVARWAKVRPAASAKGANEAMSREKPSMVRD